MSSAFRPPSDWISHRYLGLAYESLTDFEHKNGRKVAIWKGRTWRIWMILYHLVVLFMSTRLYSIGSERQILPSPAPAKRRHAPATRAQGFATCMKVWRECGAQPGVEPEVGQRRDGHRGVPGTGHPSRSRNGIQSATGTTRVKSMPH